jgi:hypothetical protein
MKKSKLFLKGLIILIIVLSFNCRKDDASVNINETTSKSAAKPGKAVERAYRDSFDTWYQFVPDFANGWDPSNPTPFLAWYPGGGDGHATHIGNAKTYFNQYVPFNPPLFSSVPAPVIMFFSTELTNAGFTNIPASVSSIVYDDKDNSIWFHQTSNSTTPASETRINFTGTADIVGCTGKFGGATGTVTLHGFFNSQDQQDASVWSEGRISY